MKKKLIFCICILLSIIMGFSVVPFSAYTYECDVEITSASVLLVNVNTDTVVYEKNADTAHFISYLSNLVTFIVACDNTDDYMKKVAITDEVLNSIPNSDGSLEPYRGKKLTIKDLLYFVMMTNGNDACYVLADSITGGDREAFVALMNKKAKDLGCKKTKFSSVAARNDTTHFSNCTDLYKIVKYALDMPEYKDVASTYAYIPEGYEGDEYTVTTTNSLLTYKSPYYYKHVKNGKYGADSVAKGNLIAVSDYADVLYACIILGAQQLSEHNAFTETRHLLNWSYTSLGNKEIISDTTVIDTVTALAPWGEVEIEMVAGKDIVKTVPAKYNAESMTFEYVPTSEIKLPVFKGQNLGTAQVKYNGEPFDEIAVVANTSSGVSMLSDVGSFLGSAFKRVIVPQMEETLSTEPTVESTEKPEKTKETETKTTQAE